MGQHEKLMISILSGRQDRNISFSDVCKLLTMLGFQMRIKGDHHIFYRTDVQEIINIQPIGKNAKAYQIKQVRDIIVKYGMELNGDEA